MSSPAPNAPSMLAYSSIQGRPALVTGLGIASIVVAGVSLVGVLVFGLLTLPWLMMAAMPGGGLPAGMGTATTPAGSVNAEEAALVASALASRQPLSQQDEAALAQALQLVELPLSPPPDGQWTASHVTQQVNYTSSWNDGTTATVSFSFQNGGAISIGGGTTTINVFTSSGFSNTTVSNGAVTGTQTGNFPAGMFDGPNLGAIVLVLASNGLSLALAVLLLIAGIQTVRGMPSGRTLHLWWAWPKLGVAILGAFAGYLFWTGSFWGVADPNGNMAMWITAGSFLWAIGWPIAVLLMLRARSLREYYGAPEAAG